MYRRYTDPKVVSLRYTDPKVVFEAKKGIGIGVLLRRSPIHLVAFGTLRKEMMRRCKAGKTYLRFFLTSLGYRHKSTTHFCSSSVNFS